MCIYIALLVHGLYVHMMDAYVPSYVKFMSLWLCFMKKSLELLCLAECTCAWKLDFSNYRDVGFLVVIH